MLINIFTLQAFAWETSHTFKSVTNHLSHSKCWWHRKRNQQWPGGGTVGQQTHPHFIQLVLPAAYSNSASISHCCYTDYSGQIYASTD